MDPSFTSTAAAVVGGLLIVEEEEGDFLSDAEEGAATGRAVFKGLLTPAIDKISRTGFVTVRSMGNLSLTYFSELRLRLHSMLTAVPINRYEIIICNGHFIDDEVDDELVAYCGPLEDPEGALADFGGELGAPLEGGVEPPAGCCDRCLRGGMEARVLYHLLVEEVVDRNIIFKNY